MDSTLFIIILTGSLTFAVFISKTLIFPILSPQTMHRFITKMSFTQYSAIYLQIGKILCSQQLQTMISLLESVRTISFSSSYIQSRYPGQSVFISQTGTISTGQFIQQMVVYFQPRQMNWLERGIGLMVLMNLLSVSIKLKQVSSEQSYREQTQTRFLDILSMPYTISPHYNTTIPKTSFRQLILVVISTLLCKLYINNLPSTATYSIPFSTKTVGIYPNSPHIISNLQDYRSNILIFINFPKSISLITFAIKLGPFYININLLVKERQIMDYTRLSFWANSTGISSQ